MDDEVPRHRRRSAGVKAKPFVVYRHAPEGSAWACPRKMAVRRYATELRAKQAIEAFKAALVYQLPGITWSIDERAT